MRGAFDEMTKPPHRRRLRRRLPVWRPPDRWRPPRPPPWRETRVPGSVFEITEHWRPPRPPPWRLWFRPLPVPWNAPGRGIGASLAAFWAAKVSHSLQRIFGRPRPSLPIWRGKRRPCALTPPPIEGRGPLPIGGGLPPIGWPYLRWRMGLPPLAGPIPPCRGVIPPCRGVRGTRVGESDPRVGEFFPWTP
jgi:hypothetical protein